MSNYNKATNFSVKDTLTSGDPDKVVSGAEIDNEFDAISSAVGSKADKVSAATTDNLAALDANGNLKDSGSTPDSIFPPGLIVLWSGAVIDVPTGWQVCDGTDGTPDLRDRFVVGAGGAYTDGETGGADSVTLTENEMPSHNHSMESAGNHSHSGSIGANGGHRHDIGFSNFDGSHYGETSVGTNNKEAGWGSAPRDSGSARTNYEGDHSHSLSIDSNGSHAHTINSTGGDQPHENRPPYYALAYIMKL